MDIGPRTMSRIIKQDLGLGAFKLQTGQRLTVALKENRKKSRRLLMYGKECQKEFLFTDENNFTVEETFNKQNDTVFAQSSKEACNVMLRFELGHYPASVMVWWDGVTSLHFCENCIKTAARHYQ